MRVVGRNINEVFVPEFDSRIKLSKQFMDVYSYCRRWRGLFKYSLLK